MLDEIDQSGADRRQGHPVIARAFGLLDDADPAIFLDRAQSRGAVRAGARQDDAGGIGLLIAGQRQEEIVDRAAQPARLDEVGQFQHAAANGQAPAGRDDIDAIGLDPLQPLALAHFQIGMPVEQLGEHGFVIGVEMLDDDERHAGRRARRGQHFAQGLQPAGRCADADHGHRGDAVILTRSGLRSLGVRAHGKAARSRSDKVSLAWAMVAAVLAIAVSDPSSTMPLSARIGVSLPRVRPSSAS